MLLKKKLAVSLVITGMSFPLLAQAMPDLYVDNYTDQFSTTKMNHKLCSTLMGEKTQPNEKNHPIKANSIISGCIGNQKDCIAEVFMTNNCGNSSQSIAIAHINTITGTMTVSPGPNTAYKLAFNNNNQSPRFTLTKA